MRDIAIIALSVALAVVLGRTGVLKSALTASTELDLLGSFLAGLFFVSVFTAAPASVVPFELA